MILHNFDHTGHQQHDVPRGGWLFAVGGINNQTDITLQNSVASVMGALPTIGELNITPETRIGHLRASLSSAKVHFSTTVKHASINLARPNSQASNIVSGNPYIASIEQPLVYNCALRAAGAGSLAQSASRDVGFAPQLKSIMSPNPRSGPAT